MKENRSKNQRYVNEESEVRLAQNYRKLISYLTFAIAKA